ncbi:hypothetical protein [Marinifilum sp. D714]|uniref:hypothetical protein n=1 Tax=Marinifilum sp. D714 TaxID=2937523 RepID=UPI0027C5FA2D|nr:hypothetical protein [Marinifilum sp. D714]MDQ2177681.1 hypothetical protein [Marinifilum sp. D714]
MINLYQSQHCSQISCKSIYSTGKKPTKSNNRIIFFVLISFIGSGGLGLINSLYTYFTFESTYPQKVEQATKGLEQLEEAGVESGFFYSMTENSLIQLEALSKNLEMITGANCLFAILSLLGVFMMFKLKKNGFYLYTFANVFWLLVPLALIDFNAMMGMTMIGAIITALFVIMYAVNLKHMK